MEDFELEKFTRSRCTFYESWEDAISILKKKEQDTLRRAIIRSLLYGEDYEKDIEKLTKAAKIAWKTIVPLIKSARKKAESGSVSKVNNPNGTNQYSENKKNSGKYVDKKEDKRRITIKKNNIKDKSTSVCTRTRAHEGNISSEDEKRLREFERLLEEKAPSFALSASPITLSKLNELKAHASAEDIIEVMEEIENKVAGDEVCRYADVATTIRTFLQTKNVWKRKES